MTVSMAYKLCSIALLGLASARSIAPVARSANISCVATGQFNVTPPAIYLDAIHACRTQEGNDVPAHKTLWFWDTTSTGGKKIVYYIQNTCSAEYAVEKIPCELQMDEIANTCKDSNGLVTGGSTHDRCIHYGLTVLESSMNMPVVNSSLTRRYSKDHGLYCPDPGSHTVPKAQLVEFSDSFCRGMNGKQLTNGTTYAGLTPKTNGSLELEITNAVGSTYTIDQHTCINEFRDIADVCSDASGAFSIGQDNGFGVIFLANMVYGGVRGAKAIGEVTESTSNNDVVKRAAPNNCPAGATSPYPADITGDVNMAIAAFCATLAGTLTKPSSTVTRNIALTNYPASGPVHFVYTNVCPVSQFFDTNGCANVLGGPVPATYNSCQFISAEGASSTHPCQHFSMLVGNL